MFDQNDKLMIQAMRAYDNPHCFNLDEFLEDYNRVNYIKRILKKYLKTGDLKERLLINHLIILYNCFGDVANKIIFSILPHEFYSYIKPFLVLLKRDEEIIMDIYNNVIILERIESDINIEKIVNKI